MRPQNYTQQRIYNNMTEESAPPPLLRQKIRYKTYEGPSGWLNFTGFFFSLSVVTTGFTDTEVI